MASCRRQSVYVRVRSTACALGTLSFQPLVGCCCGFHTQHTCVTPTIFTADLRASQSGDRQAQGRSGRLAVSLSIQSFCALTLGQLCRERQEPSTRFRVGSFASVGDLQWDDIIARLKVTTVDVACRPLVLYGFSCAGERISYGQTGQYSVVLNVAVNRL